MKYGGGTTLEVLEAIQARRSIRRYQETPVDDKTVESVLEAARWAPSWSNTQCWKFIVVRKADTRNKLADALFPLPGSDKNPAEKAVRAAPVVIVACAEREKSGYYDGRALTDKGDNWFMFDVALAMQNLALQAHALGLGTVHVGSFDAVKAAEILNVPDGFSAVEMMPLGYPDQQPHPRPRKELAEIVYYETWGAE
jgi:nitroreductase